MTNQMTSQKPKLNPFLLEDKMCKSKRKYFSIDEMKETMGSMDKKVKLFAYKCPFAETEHYHLTKHSHPIDPSLQDRVNIEL